MDGSFLGGAITGGLIGLVISSIMMLYASHRPASVALGKTTARQQVVTVLLDPAEVVSRIIKRTEGSKHKLSAMNPTRDLLVLETPTTLWSWGFFFPIRIMQIGPSTRLEVGVMGKFPAVGPIVTKAHNRCVEFLRSVLDTGSV